MFFHLVKSVGQKKNFESPWGVNLQTFRFHALMLNSLPSLLFYNYKHDLIDTTDSNSMKNTCELYDEPLSSLSLSGSENIRAWNLKVWGLIPHGDTDFLLCPTLVTRWKTYFSIITIVWQTVRRITNETLEVLSGVRI